MRKFKERKKAAPCSQLGTRPASRCQPFRLLTLEATQCRWLPSFRLLQCCFSLTVCPVISSKWHWGWFGSMCFPLWFKDRISSKNYFSAHFTCGSTVFRTKKYFFAVTWPGSHDFQSKNASIPLLPSGLKNPKARYRMWPGKFKCSSMKQTQLCWKFPYTHHGHDCHNYVGLFGGISLNYSFSKVEWLHSRYF